MRPTTEPIFGEPLDPGKSIAIPGTYFGTRYVHRPRYPVEDETTSPMPRFHERSNRWLRVALPLAILLVTLALITWLSMGYNGVR